MCGFCGNWRFELVCGKRNAPKQNQMVRTVTWLFILVLLVLLLLLLPLLLLLLIKWCCRVAFWPKRPLLELLCQVYYVMYCELWRLWYGKCGYDDLLYTYALIIMYRIAWRWIDWLMDGWAAEKRNPSDDMNSNWQREKNWPGRQATLYMCKSIGELFGRRRHKTCDDDDATRPKTNGRRWKHCTWSRGGGWCSGIHVGRVGGHWMGLRWWLRWTNCHVNLVSKYMGGGGGGGWDRRWWLWTRVWGRTINRSGDRNGLRSMKLYAIKKVITTGSCHHQHQHPATHAMLDWLTGMVRIPGRFSNRRKMSLWWLMSGRL